MNEDSIEKTERILANSKLGTVILWIIRLYENKGYIKYGDIFQKILPKGAKKDHAKISYYLTILKDFPIKYINSSDKPIYNKFEVLKNDSDGKRSGMYKFNRGELINLFIEALRAINYKYADTSFDSLLKADELRKALYKYLVYFSKKEVCWEDDDRYSISDILTNFETDLIIHYYKEDFKIPTTLKELAKEIVKDTMDENPFV